jgi:hypothetical protein
VSHFIHSFKFYAPDVKLEVKPLLELSFRDDGNQDMEDEDGPLGNLNSSMPVEPAEEKPLNWLAMQIYAKMKDSQVRNIFVDK